MCDHYTNEVNGSAVLTIRWMPPSGTCPFVCVCVCVHLRARLCEPLLLRRTERRSEVKKKNFLYFFQQTGFCHDISSPSTFPHSQTHA